MRWVLLIGLLLLPAQAHTANEATPGWDSAGQALRQDLTNRQAEGAQTEQELAGLRASLEQELKGLRSQVQEAEGLRTQQQQQLAQLQKDVAALAQAIQAEEQDLAALEGVSRSAAEDTLKSVPVLLRQRQSDVNPLVNELISDPGYPTFGQLSALVELLLQEIQQTRFPLRRSQEVVAPDGRTHTIPIVQLGPFTTLGDWEEETHFLVPEGVEGGLRLPNLSLGWGEKRALAAYWRGEASGLPFDLSSGAVLEQRAVERTLTRQLADGGWIVWPILAIGGIALLLVLERALVLSRVRLDSRQLHQQVSQLLAGGQIRQGLAACQAHSRNPSARVLEAGLNHAGQAADVVENALHEAILRQIPNLERFLPTLSVLGAVAPLLGLLGTVTGMIGTFRSITLYGTGNPGLMSGGISEALITTQLGLAVAIPILLLHHFLERRVERVVDRMEQTAITFVQPLAETEPDP